MAYSISSKEERDYLILKVFGDRTPEDIVKIAQECIQIATSQEHTNILVDVLELKGRLSIPQIFLLVTNKLLRFRGQSNVKKVAIIDHEKNKPRYRFFETVAHNRGINMKVFHQFSNAKEWLI